MWRTFLDTASVSLNAFKLCAALFPLLAFEVGEGWGIPGPVLPVLVVLTQRVRTTRTRFPTGEAPPLRVTQSHLARAPLLRTARFLIR